mmetsp:Transcript_61745/g.159281  ORF Transcript_61745/g.159281 Transcript_61745/m.159281 type:complete len:315 (-) Transcript_61745:198-1142(-)
MRPRASQSTPLLVFVGVSARITASRLRSCQRGGQWLGKLPRRTSCTRTCDATWFPMASTPTNSHSSPASKLWSSNTAASPNGLPLDSSDASRRSTTRLCSGCINHTEALRHSSPRVTSMSPSGCGTVTRSVSTKPAFASTTTPAPRQQMLSPSTFSPSSTMSKSKFCTVRKRTEQMVLSSAALAVTCLFLRLLRAFFRGEPSSGADEGSDASDRSSSAGAALTGASRRRGVQTRVVRSRLHARSANQWRAIFTGPSHFRRSLAHFGTIHVTWKYSLFGTCCRASSKAHRFGQALPFSSKITASVLTDSPKTKPA